MLCNYLVSPDYETAKIFYATITNGTIGTINTYPYLSNNIGFCSVANNGNCLFFGPSNMYLIFNFEKKVVTSLNLYSAPKITTSRFSPSGNYYVFIHRTPTNPYPEQVIIKSP